ncbi:hypothetical protein GCM10023220_02470 [Streptomyces ziwulingensis]|uniref:Uncharacterized protein n=1 Tax=Streptomyces ziwulingensis TaxID=1045501 RepID=A0ABP9AQH7_9ACTN
MFPDRCWRAARRSTTPLSGAVRTILPPAPAPAPALAPAPVLSPAGPDPAGLSARGSSLITHPRSTLRNPEAGEQRTARPGPGVRNGPFGRALREADHLP